MIYIASPYSHEDKEVEVHRFNEVCKLNQTLLNQ